MMKRTLSLLLLPVILLSSCGPKVPEGEENVQESSSSTEEQTGGEFDIPDFHFNGTANAASFGADVSYEAPSTPINPALSVDFSIEEAKNLDEMLTTYGITLSAKDRENLKERKFIVKRLLETNIRPVYRRSYGEFERAREFLLLYSAVGGDWNPDERTQANSIFWTPDVFLHSYNLLGTELLKEMENKTFAPAMRSLTKMMYENASEKFAAATVDPEKLKWQKIRNYFAVPYALFATSILPLTEEDYYSRNRENQDQDPSDYYEEWKSKDAKMDNEENAIIFIETLGLEEENKKIILQDLHTIFAAETQLIPEVFKKEYQDYAEKMKIGFKVDFSQFTPRSHYTGSSLRRQYFRAMNWYIQLPFFVESDPLTEYAFGISELLAGEPEHLKNYSLLESTINFLVGTSDDLMPVDYLAALEESKGKPNQEEAIREYLKKTKEPKIKSLSASYPEVGTTQSADVISATKGMRFFSGKFIIDSYWSDYLTQGDEAPLPGYTQKLPPMASSLEIMAILGSDYAKEKIPTLDFYNSANSEAIKKAMGELEQEVNIMEESDWTENAYTTALWTTRGLFEWERENKAKLPRFMQSDAWPVKTLQAASGFWTEMRHMVLLYAKQSFAELGGGPPCYRIAEPPKSYIEPQLIAYKRLEYLAKRLKSGLENLGFGDGALQNMYPLDSYIGLMANVTKYTEKELQNTEFKETISKEMYDVDGDDIAETCENLDESDWEAMRREMLQDLGDSLPIPVEGKVLPAKDKRAAIVADVHTGGDSSYPHRILYEGTGVPNVILVAVKDVNGTRFTIGFTYSHYEFTEPLGGQRLTDEKWQEKFYVGTDENTPFEYTELSLWPKPNSWYAPILGE